MIPFLAYRDPSLQARRAGARWLILAMGLGFSGLFVLSSGVFSSGHAASDLGVTGLIDIPTARMMRDGDFATSLVYQDRADIYSLTYQATPWLETTFRYTVFNEFFYADRSYEAKFKLLDESPYFPALAVGIRDILGTGILGSEYIVGSKKWGNFDVSLGVGWGRLADRGDFKNPFRALGESYAVRDADFGKGGEVEVDTFFRGPDVGFFGGVEYQIPNWPAKLMVEYNPDEYRWEVARGGAKPKSPMSYGVSYDVLPGVNIALSQQHDDDFAVRITATLATARDFPRFPVKARKLARDYGLDEAPEGYDFATWHDRLRYDMGRYGLVFYEGKLEGDRAILKIGNARFPLWPDAAAQAFLLADLNLPPEIEIVDLIIVEDGHPVHTLASRRYRPTDEYYGGTFGDQISILHGRDLDAPKFVNPLAWRLPPLDVTLANRFQFFDPTEPIRYQIYASLKSSLRLNKNTRVKVGYALDLKNSFESVSTTSDSQLPPVRTDIGRYLREGQSGIHHFYVEQRDHIAPQILYRAYAGILENMYSGVGGEVLFQPHSSRVAVSASANWVKKRAYDRQFDHLDFETHTAFVSAFWATPFYNYDVGVHMGRFLAGDVGAAFEVRRTFANGFTMGAFATLTDVSAEEYGEGSFDKGLFFKVPFAALFGKNTRGSYSTRLRSLQRDGGQRLENFSGNIWFNIREARYDVFDQNRDRLAP